VDENIDGIKEVFFIGEMSILKYVLAFLKVFGSFTCGNNAKFYKKA